MGLQASRVDLSSAFSMMADRVKSPPPGSRPSPWPAVCVMFPAL